MNNTEMKTLTDSIQSKLGTENSGLIADDIATLLTDCNMMNTQISQKDSEIEQLKKDKENLMNVNGNLLQKVTMDFEKPENNSNPNNEAPKIIDINTAFDKKGNFI